ncbi:MAG: SpoIID/LytB domain-containing protein [Xanthomonadales bacterium]|nr:SpoIID/LytB domain-containing protein [Xanthomonadales bacterium]
MHGVPPSASAKGVPQSLDDPPPSIRVGFADAACTQTCCGTGCAHVCVFDLESYVRRGITHEWIASWHPHALRAGTVAYRGYGAWRVANPIAAQYDICSSACCQVNGGTVHSSGASAVARTRGILLLRAGARFAAEYSAENNCLLGTLSCSNPDLSCGNGFNGSPSRGWPCLSDPVGLNRECFGHGRGMSQWGSQRWATHAATPRSWPWIVDHYYNAHGAGSGQRTAVMSRVLALEGAALLPPAVAPGQSFTIRLQARNRAAEPHERVLAGASIRRPGGPWISDPANDQALVLPSGLSQPERPFRVPAGTEAGSYEVALSLYLDIDEDGAIAGGDLPVASLTLPGALTVLALSPEVFSDGFESP